MKKQAQAIVDRVVGTPESVTLTVEDLIVEGVITQDQWDLHELEILRLVDEEMFECETCSWNCYIWEMSETPYLCTDCGDN